MPSLLVLFRSCMFSLFAHCIILFFVRFRSHSVYCHPLSPWTVSPRIAFFQLSSSLNHCMTTIPLLPYIHLRVVDFCCQISIHRRMNLRNSKVPPNPDTFIGETRRAAASDVESGVSEPNWLRLRRVPTRLNFAFYHHQPSVTAV